MLDNIILLTGPVEESALAGALRGHNPRLAIHPKRIFQPSHCYPRKGLTSGACGVPAQLQWHSPFRILHGDDALTANVL
jgi:hypothetical protein